MSDLPDLLAPPPILGVITQLADCLCDEVNGLSTTPLCWCGPVAGGEVAFDNCGGDCTDGRCGKAWVQIVSAAPYATFPLPDSTLGCGKPVLYQVEVGVMRCIPTGPEALSPEATVEALVLQLLDERAMYRALLCCSSRNVLIAPQQYTPRGPEGMCVGGIWLAAIAVEP